MTQLQLPVNPIAQAANNAAGKSDMRHALKIAEALSPDPREWRYTEEVLDMGFYGASHCACGHPIRYVFSLCHPDGREALIGSSCIESTVPFLLEHGAQEIADALNRAKKKHEVHLAEIERRKLEAKAEQELDKLFEDWNNLRNWFEEIRKKETSAAHADFARQLEKVPEKTSTAGRQVAAVRSCLSRLWCSAVCFSNNPGVPIPVPKASSLQKKLLEDVQRCEKKFAKKVVHYAAQASHYALCEAACERFLKDHE